ncbi:hypothetical protein NECAME_02711 [Necator americanus]|uniref:Uncharacterized protein n=1 Tax=Necator americanus TaxID=51031 RepID=W2TB86_NECAM|nr:hypothetical protein NECAME_02711 [Necator americanus]ETN79285.1 hypothetical protein NECAME_02711 [Necator americanus]
MSTACSFRVKREELAHREKFGLGATDSFVRISEKTALFAVPQFCPMRAPERWMIRSVYGKVNFWKQR